MASPKSLHSLHIFSFKSSSSTITLNSMKFKNIVQTFILSHFCHIDRALTKAKDILIELLKDIHFINLIEFTTKKQKNKNKLLFGSFRLHYNWCSAHVLPVPSPQVNKIPISHSYYNSTWDLIISPDSDDMEESQLSGYLHWLGKKVHEESKKSTDHKNEIDKLADRFIANCHEKFMLEKQESYRMFQEMMARSM